MRTFPAHILIEMEHNVVRVCMRMRMCVEIIGEGG